MSEPIIFYSEAHNCNKGQGTDPYIHTATDLIDRLRPVTDFIGLKRLADLSTIDRLGFSVANAIRPFPNGYSVSHGKGNSVGAAKASAVMESIERFHTAPESVGFYRASYNELVDQNKTVIPVEFLPLSKQNFWTRDTVELWHDCFDIINRKEVPVPWELVVMPRGREHNSNFCTSSNGMSSGTTFLEALSQALLEVIERDAVSCHHLAKKLSGSPALPRPLDYESIPYDSVKDKIKRCRDAKVEPLIFECSNEFGIPVYECGLVDLMEKDMPFTTGWGAGLDDENALSRAINEAAQARAIFLSGVRETFLEPDMYNNRYDDSSENIAAFHAQGKAAGYYPVKGQQKKIPDSFEGDVKEIIVQLRENGIHQILVKDLTCPEIKDHVRVIRVVVPGLDGPSELPNYAPGNRATRSANALLESDGGVNR
ncbi:YcaO-like family protein [Desulforhopalus sp. 52FAK]